LHLLVESLLTFSGGGKFQTWHAGSSSTLAKEAPVRRVVKVVWGMLRLLVAGILLGLAVWCWTRTGAGVSHPLTPLSSLKDLVGKADQDIVRVSGQVVADNDNPIALERIVVDTGKRRPGLDWKQVLKGQGRPAGEPEFDMVSPPRITLVDGDVSVLLQTEDIELRCWPAAVDERVGVGVPYPQSLLDKLPTLPDLPVLRDPARVRMWKLAQHAPVTVVGRVVLEGEQVDIEAPQTEPFVISPLGYDEILSKERQISGWHEALGGLCALGAVALLATLLRRR
jgi:hypothetical protein